jgi:hypothetical protein
LEQLAFDLYITCFLSIFVATGYLWEDTYGNSDQMIAFLLADWLPLAHDTHWNLWEAYRLF